MVIKENATIGQSKGAKAVTSSAPRGESGSLIEPPTKQKAALVTIRKRIATLAILREKRNCK
jgi:hypothetical protein